MVRILSPEFGINMYLSCVSLLKKNTSYNNKTNFSNFKPMVDSADTIVYKPSFS